MKFLIINGVNLNLTGLREKSVYGSESLSDIEGKNRRVLQRGTETKRNFFRATSKERSAISSTRYF